MSATATAAATATTADDAGWETVQTRSSKSRQKQQERRKKQQENREKRLYLKFGLLRGILESEMSEGAWKSLQNLYNVLLDVMQFVSPPEDRQDVDDVLRGISEDDFAAFDGKVFVAVQHARDVLEALQHTVMESVETRTAPVVENLSRVNFKFLDMIPEGSLPKSVSKAISHLYSVLNDTNQFVLNSVKNQTSQKKEQRRKTRRRKARVVQSESSPVTTTQTSQTTQQSVFDTFLGSDSDSD